jgi:hypothetical protein
MNTIKYHYYKKIKISQDTSLPGPYKFYLGWDGQRCATVYFKNLQCAYRYYTEVLPYGHPSILGFCSPCCDAEKCYMLKKLIISAVESKRKKKMEELFKFITLHKLKQHLLKK